MYETTKLANLNRHKDTCLTEAKLMTKDIPCPVCGKMYTRNDSMKLHMKQIHKVNQTKEIVETPIGFIKFDEEQLDKNCNNTMTFKEQHICDVCGYKHDYKSKVIQLIWRSTFKNIEDTHHI